MEAFVGKASNYRQHLAGHPGIVEFQDRLDREIREFGFASFEEQVHHCCELVPVQQPARLLDGVPERLRGRLTGPGQRLQVVSVRDGGREQSVQPGLVAVGQRTEIAERQGSRLARDIDRAE